MNSLSGAVIGVGAISLLIEVLRQLEHGFVLGPRSVAAPGGTQEIGLGVAMLLVLIFRRGGITGNQEIGGQLARWARRTAAAAGSGSVAVSKHSSSVPGRPEKLT
jgi:branched-chain amino acid transport system permease protein